MTTGVFCGKMDIIKFSNRVFLGDKLLIIDFHTHIFPDKISEHAISSMEKSGGIPAETRGTAAELRSSMYEAGIDASLVLPVVTNPKQFDSINRFAAGINGVDGLYSFGGIHPDNDIIEEKLDYIKSLGLRGIKLHPDYQNTFIDDERYVRIISYCIDIGLYVVTHSGLDVSYLNTVHCTPDRVLSLFSKLPEHSEPRLILAHIGAAGMFDEVEEKLAGKNVYFDLAFCLDMIGKEQLMRIIEKHGSDKILFASDSPWKSQKKFVEVFNSLALSENDRENIAHKNAERILGL